MAASAKKVADSAGPGRFSKHRPRAQARARVSFHLFRTVFYLIPLIAIYTIVLGTLSIASSVFSRAGRFAHHCARAWAWLILATTGVNVQIRGLDRVPRNKPFLFISNHQSIYDIPVLFWYLPYQL